jgi:hypothetical protein
VSIHNHDPSIHQHDPSIHDHDPSIHNHESSIENHLATSGPVPPGAPVLWYDAQDVNFGAAQPADGAAVTTWKNKGSAGAGGDATQGVAGARPTFRLVGDVGTINDLSAVSFDGGDLLRSGAVSAMAQPTMIASVVQFNGGAVFHDGRDGVSRNQVWVGGGFFSLYAGSVVTGNIAAVVGSYHQQVSVFNGASTTIRVDKADSSTGNPGAAGLDGITIGAGGDDSGPLTGHVVELLVYNGSLPSVADVEAYFDTKYGGTWPQ